MGRYVTDENTGTHLLFPDIALLKLVDESTENGRVFVSISVVLRAPVGEDGIPQPHREIILTDHWMNIARPNDPNIIQFRFVRKAGLSGSITMVTKAVDWPEIKQRLVNEQDYLQIEYKGNSEEYVSLKIIAKFHLDAADYKVLSGKTLLWAQLSLLRKWMEDRSAMSTTDVDLWLQDAVDRYFPVHIKNGSHVLKINGLIDKIEYMRPVVNVDAITADPSHLSLKWE